MAEGVPRQVVDKSTCSGSNPMSMRDVRSRCFSGSNRSLQKLNQVLFGDVAVRAMRLEKRIVGALVEFHTDFFADSLG